MMNPVQHAETIRSRYQGAGKPMEVAIFVGHHPAYHIGAASRGQLEHDELAVTGGLLGEAVELVPCKTVDMAVPAYAEVVIEGRIQPGNFEMDGPFGEYAGYYGDGKNVPIIDVTAITHRKQPIWHDLYPSFREHTQVGVLAREAQLFRLKKRVQGEGKLAGLVVLGSHYDVKHVVVVDDDIDIYNDEAVLWAIATRLQADRDCSYITNSFGAHLDPSAYGEIRHEHGPMTTKVIFDTTRPLNSKFPERVTPSKKVWDDIDLREYVPGL
jgi:2,5-furandicarboxylate decarboxylase 1